jgi:hypothetical protein
METNKSLLNPADYQQMLQRIDTITPETKPKWGDMDAAKMFGHCSEIQEVSNGKPLENTPFLVKIFKGFIRKMVVNDKPYKPSTQTHPQYRKTTPHEFDKEKARLLAALDLFHNESSEERKKKKHPLFGEMSDQEKGWAMYKHLDHHLSQFGV